jgi:hypothetical protein
LRLTQLSITTTLIAVELLYPQFTQYISFEDDLVSNWRGVQAQIQLTSQTEAKDGYQVLVVSDTSSQSCGFAQFACSPGASIGGKTFLVQAHVKATDTLVAYLELTDGEAEASPKRYITVTPEWQQTDLSFCWAPENYHSQFLLNIGPSGAGREADKHSCYVDAIRIMECLPPGTVLPSGRTTAKLEPPEGYAYFGASDWQVPSAEFLVGKTFSGQVTLSTLIWRWWPTHPLHFPNWFCDFVVASDSYRIPYLQLSTGDNNCLDCPPDSSRNIWPEDIVAGRYDSELDQFFIDAKDFGYPFFLDYEQEANGWWNYNTYVNPDAYVAAFQYMVNRSRQLGADNITWIWHMASNYEHATYFPGNEYVDWIGFSQYQGSWDHVETFYSSYPDKPVMLSEGSTKDFGVAWIDEFFSRAVSWPRLKGAFFWNFDYGGRNTRFVDTGGQPYIEAWQAGFASSRYLTSAIYHRWHPRPGQIVITEVPADTSHSPSGQIILWIHPSVDNTGDEKVHIVGIGMSYGDSALVTQKIPSEPLILPITVEGHGTTRIDIPVDTLEEFQVPPEEILISIYGYRHYSNSLIAPARYGTRPRDISDWHSIPETANFYDGANTIVTFPLYIGNEEVLLGNPGLVRSIIGGQYYTLSMLCKGQASRDSFSTVIEWLDHRGELIKADRHGFAVNDVWESYSYSTQAPSNAWLYMLALHTGNPDNTVMLDHLALIPGTRNYNLTAHSQADLSMLSTNIKNPPLDYSLKQNYPNPFNISTDIEFYLPVDTQVRINIYNVRGEVVVELVNDRFQLGKHIARWNAHDQSSGIYFYQIQTSQFSQARKMLLLK